MVYDRDGSAFREPQPGPYTRRKHHDVYQTKICRRRLHCSSSFCSKLIRTNNTNERETTKRSVILASNCDTGKIDFSIESEEITDTPVDISVSKHNMSVYSRHQRVRLTNRAPDTATTERRTSKAVGYRSSKHTVVEQRLKTTRKGYVVEVWAVMVLYHTWKPAPLSYAPTRRP